MKAYTDIKQSKKLVEFLPLKSADMRYAPFGDIHPWFLSNDLIEKGSTPCWSLAALMDVLERGTLFKTPKGWACQAYVESKAITSNYHSNPVDAYVEIILELHKQKLL